MNFGILAIIAGIVIVASTAMAAKPDEERVYVPYIPEPFVPDPDEPPAWSAYQGYPLAISKF